MTTYQVTFGQMDGCVAYTFFDDGKLKCISIDAVVITAELHMWLLQHIPGSFTIFNHWIVNLKAAGKAISMTTVETTIAFEIFWLKYPRKLDRGRAEEVWNRLKATEKQQAYELLPNYIAMRQSDGTSLCYAKQYLKDKLWRDFIKD